ncbi:MAG: hypothetical protein MUE58_02745 [Chitinophagaceae bacterium]|nr:hypothetical protein [Chitinophagaceae bacterium]
MKRCLLLTAFCISLAQTFFAQPLDMSKFSSWKPRNVGPAGMSGRVTALDVNLKNPDIIYAGTASGGLWRSDGGGTSWTPLFDSMDVASIGAIAIDQRNPQVIWVGTGEGNPRNSQTMGGGIYKSMDGGKTWKNTGLQKTRTIHRMIIHAHNPDVVYASALGTSWGDTPDRGVYRTKDGGKTWERILFVNERTGAGDFIVDPSNPNRMLVSMWEYRRWPWFFKSGGPGSGLYLTTDGGDTWKKLTEKDGLPGGELGKMGLAWSRSNPQVVYALIESKKNALYRSDDGGLTWAMTTDKNIGDRPFYYSDIHVDPSNENRVYNVFSNVTVSDDGGKNFKTLLGWDNIHGDHHSYWIHPNDPQFMIDGNDGGLAITRDKGKSWTFSENLPVGQFYHINYDMQIPYNLYGGMQDNGTWRGPAYRWQTGGVRNHMWDEIAFGDGFDVVVEPNQRYGYAMWQGGNLLRVDFETGASQPCKPVHPDGVFLRFNWNAGIGQDPMEPNTIYYGSQFLHRSTDQGKSWTIISPDLTTNDTAKIKAHLSGGLTYDVTGAENHCTIIAISASPRKKGVIWVGTDDGNIQVTRDGGTSWTNVARNIPGVPAGSWVPQVHASAYNEGEAFVVINNYRRNDWSPWIFRTRDFGKTWERLVDEKKVNGYMLCFVQDPVEPKLMFAGSEFGLYVSVDEGKNWTKWTSGYPTVSTYDLAIHPREHDLLIATFGRALWVLDDIRPLREIAKNPANALQKNLRVYPAPDAYLAHLKEGAGTRFTGNAIYKGENRPYGAEISFSILDLLKKDAKPDITETDTVKVEIVDSRGKVVRHMEHQAVRGMNRIYWLLNRDGIRFPTQPKPKQQVVPSDGMYVAPGTYIARVSYKTHMDSTRIEVKADPRAPVDAAGLAAWDAASWETQQMITGLTASMDKLRDAKERMGTIDPLAKAQVKDTAMLRRYNDQKSRVEKTIDSLSRKMMPGEDIQGIYEDPSQLVNQLQSLVFYLDPAFGTPNPPTGAPPSTFGLSMKKVKSNADAFNNSVDAFVNGQWREFEGLVKGMNLQLLQPLGQ